MPSRAKARRQLRRWDTYLDKVYPTVSNYRHHWGYYRAVLRYREKTTWNLMMAARREGIPAEFWWG